MKTSKLRSQFIFLIFSLLLITNTTFAATTANISSPNDNSWKVELYTFGAGDSVEELWGHDALYFYNKDTKEEHFYNWGMFNFDTDLAKGMLTGNLKFWVEDINIYPSLRLYKRANRDIIIQELNLSTTTTNQLLEQIKINVLPKNREYNYNYFENNCTTRIRDVLNTALNNQIATKYNNEYSKFTTRDHMHRLTSPLWYIDLLYNFLLSNGVDKKLSKWGEMFLPEQLEYHLNNFEYQNEKNETVKLVKKYTTLFKASNKTEAKAIQYFPFDLSLGVLWLIICGVLAYKTSKQPSGLKLSIRLGVGFSFFLFGMVSGLFGAILLILNIFSAHTYTYFNQNILFMSPLNLLFLGFAIYALFNRPINKKFGLTFIVISAFTISFALGLKLFPSLYQDNSTYMLACIPASLGNLVLLWQRLYEKKAQPTKLK